MPNNYNGVAGDADFTTPPGIILDGEVWQFGDPTTGAGGHFAATRQSLARLAWLKANAAFLSANQTFTGLVTFNNILAIKGGGHLNIDGGSGSAIVQVIGGGQILVDGSSAVHLASGADFEVACPIQLQSGGFLSPRVHQASNASATFELGAIGDVVVTAAPITGSDKTWTFTAPASGLPARCEVVYYGDIDSSLKPSAWGDVSSNNLTVVAGRASAFMTPGHHISRCVVYYDGTELFIAGPSGSY